MAPFGKIYSYMPNSRVAKIQAAASINGLELEIASDFEMGITNRKAEFMSKFPTGKVPAFEGANGVTLFESDAIAQYVAESGPKATQLLGGDAAQRAKVRQWACFAEGQLFQPLTPLVLVRLGMIPYDEQREKKDLAAVEKALAVVEGYLEGKTWLVTEKEPSLADLSLAAPIWFGFTHVVDAEMRKNFPNVVAWYLRTIGSDGAKEAFGPPNWIAVRQTPGA